MTDRQIKNLKPGDRPYRVTDKGGTRGLNLQVLPTGTKKWMVRYSDATGRERFHTFGEYPAVSLAEARQQAIDLKTEAKTHGEIRKPEESEPETRTGTVRDLMDGYINDMRDRGKSSADQVEARIRNHLLEEIGDRPANSITETDINAVLSTVYKAGHRPMANRLRSYIVSAYKWGKRHDRDYRYHGDGLQFEIQANPAADIPRDSAGERPTDRYLSWHEARAFWHACEDVVSVPMKIAVQFNITVGGQRSGEILGIHDREIDHARQVWTLPASRTKNGREHTIPLTDLALELLEQACIYRGRSRYLFPMRGDKDRPTRIDSLYTGIRRYCERTPWGAWTPKDIRTTFKTLGGEIGLSKEIRDRIQNHAMTDVSSRHYDRWSYLPEKRKALQMWSEEIERRVVPSDRERSDTHR